MIDITGAVYLKEGGINIRGLLAVTKMVPQLIIIHFVGFVSL